MKILSVKLKDQTYPLFIANGWQKSWAKTLQHIAPDKTLFILTQASLKKWHGDTWAKALPGFTLHWIVLPDGEPHKTLKTCETVLQKLVKRGAHRGSTLVAFGGGMVGDITGFVASIYMRGIRFVQIPTTLLAQVDASVGGKTGVDLAGGGKNLVGAFKQPQAVFINTAFLKTLPQREFASGMAEVIKAALISSAPFCRFLIKHAADIRAQKPDAVLQMLTRALKVKIALVEKDEKEHGDRALLNYGHTLGHAIETLTGYKTVKHGEAVAMGLVFAAHLADRLECAASSTHADVIRLLTAYDLPTAWPRFAKSRYQKVLKTDKKGFLQTIRFILPQKLGKVAIKLLQIKDITRWL